MIRRLFLAAVMGAALIACTPSDGTTPGTETAPPLFTPPPSLDASPEMSPEMSPEASASDVLPTVSP